MTTFDHRPNAPTGHEDPKAQAQRAAEVAKEQGKHVGDVAKSEAQNVTAEAQQQVRNLVGEARTQLEEQSRTQLDSLVTMLQGVGEDLERMARGEGTSAGIAQDVVSQVSEKARALSSQIKDREPGELLDEVRGFARRKPGTFLLGALAAGVVAGRLARGAKDAHDSSPTQVTSSGTGSTQGQPMMQAPTTTQLPSSGPGLTAPGQAGGTAAADPLAGTGTPTESPAYPEGTPVSSTEWGTP